MLRSMVLAAVATLAAGVAGAAAQSRAEPDLLMTPREAHAKAMAGTLVLVDIRTPEEWRETGIPASARAITMHQDTAAMLAALEAATGSDKSRPLALICRTGTRTTALKTELEKRGYTHVINVAEGVVGGRYGSGWLKAGLPVKQP